MMKKTKKAILRGAEFKDAEGIFALIKKYPEELLPRPVSDIVQNIDRFLIAEIKGRIVGTVSWHILPEIGAPRRPSVEIKSLAVDPDCRRAGIGSALVKGAIKRIRTMHPAQVVALTFSPEFFGSLGFRKVPKKKLMHKLYMGCINCSKYDSPFTCPEIAMALTIPDSDAAN